MAKEKGPYLRVAAICKDVLEEKDGTLSLIKLVDNFTQVRNGPNPPEEMPPFTLATKMVISFKAGGATGDFSAKFELINPSGKKLEEEGYQFTLEDPAGGHNIIVDLTFDATEPGVYWIYLFLNGEVKAHVPMKVNYIRDPQEPVDDNQES